MDQYHHPGNTDLIFGRYTEAQLFTFVVLVSLVCGAVWLFTNYEIATILQFASSHWIDIWIVSAYLFACVLCSVVAETKNHTSSLWFLTAIFITPPIAIIALMGLGAAGRICKICRETHRDGAQICPHCGCDPSDWQKYHQL